MIPESEWKWHGSRAHMANALMGMIPCDSFWMVTEVGDYLVSTSGDFRLKRFTTIVIRYFLPFCQCGCGCVANTAEPVGEPIETTSPELAETTHRETCLRYAHKGQPSRSQFDAQRN